MESMARKVAAAMARTIFTGGLVLDGDGAPPTPGEVIVDGRRIADVRTGWARRHEADHVVDASGCTVMPGMVESHAHLTFPSAIGHIDRSFNPPLDVTFFQQEHSLEVELGRAARNARILLDAGFTSAYSAGSLLPIPTEVILRDKIDAGALPGPRMRACGMERDSRPIQTDGRLESGGRGPEACRAWIRQQATVGFDSAKLLLSNDDVFVEGGSQMTQYSQEEASAAAEQALESGLWLNCHAQSAESIKIAVRAGFRSFYHCTYADDEALDLLESVKDRVFVSPALGIIYANVYEGGAYGIDRATAERMGAAAALERMMEVYPKMRKRGIRVLPGGDYGFPNNPIGRNARDLQLLMELAGFTALEVLTAATKYGGQLMGMGHELGRLSPGYLADLLVVRGNPAEDITVLQNPDNLVCLMQAGDLRRPPGERAVIEVASQSPRGSAAFGG